MTMRAHPTSCGRCGAPLQPSQRTKRQRHPEWVCDFCGNQHWDVELRDYLEARWVDAGRPLWDGKRQLVTPRQPSGERRSAGSR